MAVPIIKRVLTATDFSDSANQALDYAGFFAKTFSVPLDILHVTELLPDMDAADVEADVYFTERRKMAQGLLAELVEHSAATGVVTRFKHRLGIPSQEITKTAAECGVDLIVLGSQGRSGLADIALGSTADRVVRGASCPVVTVRALPEYGRCTGDRSKKTPPAIHHILAPVDFSKCSLEALDYAALLAAQFQADLTVVRCIAPDLLRSGTGIRPGHGRTGKKGAGGGATDRSRRAARARRSDCENTHSRRRGVRFHSRRRVSHHSRSGRHGHPWSADLDEIIQRQRCRGRPAAGSLSGPDLTEPSGR